MLKSADNNSQDSLFEQVEALPTKQHGSKNTDVRPQADMGVTLALTAVHSIKHYLARRWLPWIQARGVGELYGRPEQLSAVLGGHCGSKIVKAQLPHEPCHIISLSPSMPLIGRLHLQCQGEDEISNIADALPSGMPLMCRLQLQQNCDCAMLDIGPAGPSQAPFVCTS